MARIISADELCDCPNKVRELCSDACKHRRPWGTGKSLLERYQAQQAKRDTYEWCTQHEGPDHDCHDLLH